MKIFYINLDRRPDRRAFIEAQLEKLGLEAERISAVTPDALPVEALRFCDERRDLWVSPVELSCTYSHRKAWQAIVDRGLSKAIVLEDDAVLSEALPAKLDDISQALERVDLIKMETRIMSVLTEAESAGWLRRLFSFHYGSAAYAVSGRAAQLMLNNPLHDIPLDDYLFDPNSPIFKRLEVRQAVPALSIPLDQLGRSNNHTEAASDIANEGSRRSAAIYSARHVFGWTMFRYAARRIRQLGSFWLSRLFGHRRLAKWSIIQFGAGRDVR